jgi:hypothetical protein
MHLCKKERKKVPFTAKKPDLGKLKKDFSSPKVWFPPSKKYYHPCLSPPYITSTIINCSIQGKNSQKLIIINLSKQNQ